MATHDFATARSQNTCQARRFPLQVRARTAVSRYGGKVTRKSVYVAAPEGRVGKSAVALGLIDELQRQVGEVGIFRPLVDADGDAITRILLEATGSKQSYEETVGVTFNQAMRNPQESLSEIVSRYGALTDRFEAIVIVGSDYSGVSSPTELNFNAQIAANLNAPVILVVSGRDRDTEKVMGSISTARAVFERTHDRIISVVATGVPSENVDELQQAMRGLPEDELTFAIPDSRVLNAPSVREQFEALGAQFLRGDETQLDREALDVVICAMTLPNVLDHLTAEATAVIASDRLDLLPGLLLANASGQFPSLAAIFLVGGYPLPESFMRLIDANPSGVPIGVVQRGSYHTASKLHSLHGSTLGSKRKVDEARRLFQDHVDAAKLLAALDFPRTQLRTPRMFEYQIMQKAKQAKKTIVLPESEDPRILEAASILLSRGVAELILLGEEAEVKEHANRLGFDISGAQIVSLSDERYTEQFAEKYAELRAKKGVTIEQARERMQDPSYFGTMMVYQGLADGMVSGATHTTANTIRPALEFVKTKPGVSVVSGAFLMAMEDRVLVFADCAVNPDPSAEQLADIAMSSAATARAFDIEPRVAMLSYSTGTSGSGADVEEVKQATEIVLERGPDFAVAGPIQFDAAIDPTVGKKKMPDNEVAGNATVFIFPDLNTGNNTYKAVQRTAGAVAIGPVLQGLNKPVNDLSRGALVEDIVNTVAITAIQAETGI